MALQDAFVDWNTVNFAVTVVTAVGGLAMWLNAQFNNSRKQFYSQIKEVYDKIGRFELNFENKLDYHEKHDDKRFADLSDDIWAMRVRNAAVDKVYLDKGRHKLELESETAETL